MKKILLILSLLPFNSMIAQKTNYITYLFAHGAFDNGTQAKKYTPLMPGETSSFHFPEANKMQYMPKGLLKRLRFLKSLRKVNKLWRGNLAQTKDIATIHRACGKIKGSKVLTGMSRGAATIVSYLALRQEDPSIKAAVLESPFAQQSDTGSYPLLKALFWRYKKREATPLDLLDQVDKNIPMFFVCSKKDQRVPAKSTIHLYKKRRETAPDNTYLLVLPEGKHSKLVKGKHKEVYHAAVHAFYEKHDLPHDAKLAENGSSILEQCQPDIDTISDYLQTV